MQSFPAHKNGLDLRIWFHRIWLETWTSCIQDFYNTAGTPRHFEAPATWVALQWEGTYNNNIERIQWGCSNLTAPLPKSPAFQRTTGPGALDWKYVCMWAPPYSGAPTRRQRLSPLKNQRDEEQRQPGTMRSRLPRTACLLRLIALCILLAHSAAYFGSADFLITSAHHINWLPLLF